MGGSLSFVSLPYPIRKHLNMKTKSSNSSELFPFMSKKANVNRILFRILENDDSINVGISSNMFIFAKLLVLK
jgi:hypothetical protein